MDPARGLSLRSRRALRAAMRDELARLDGQIAALARSFDDIVDAATLTSTDDEHDPEGSTIAFERAQVRSLLRLARGERAALLDALAHVDDAGYGACERCHGEIGVERLLALPGTTRCVGCAR